MAKKKMEEIDLSEDLKLKEIPLNKEPEKQVENYHVVKEHEDKPEVTNCLRNERIIVRFIPKTGGIWGDNPRHVLYGGMAENATRTFVVPRLSSGVFVNVLTDNEKAFLEEAMGLEYNALSIYKKTNNFWDDTNEVGINKVTLHKQDNILDLSTPDDYIRYKILLANKDLIAPSLKALQDTPKASYQFVIVSDGEENKVARKNMSNTMMCYKEFGKIEDDVDTLRVIIEIMTGRVTSKNTNLEFLQTQINNLIQSNSRLFLNVVTDDLLKAKVLIRQSVENGKIANRGGMYYLINGNLPLCDNNQDPTLNNAASYIMKPKHQDILFALQAALQ